MAGSRKLTTAEEWRDAPIDDYVNEVAIVWEPHDKIRSMIDLWLRVVQHGSQLGELVRRQRYQGAQAQLGRLAIWMLSFAAKGLSQRRGIDGLFRLEAPLSRILWDKYPNACSACYTRRVALAKEPELWEGETQECNCILTLAETEDRGVILTPEQKTEAKMHRRDYAQLHWADSDYGVLSLKELEDRFALMFRRNTFAMDLETLAFHFLEEVGEVAEALTDLYTYVNVAESSLGEEWQARRFELEEELADSFSWLFAISSKFRDIFQVFDSYTENTHIAQDMYIASHLRKRHMSDATSLMICWDCKQAVCGCNIRLIVTDPEADEILGAAPK